MAIAYDELKKALGISSGDLYVYDVIQQLAIVEPAVADALGVDTIELGRAFLQDTSGWRDWVLPNGVPCKVPDYVHLEARDGDWYLLGAEGRELGVQKQGCLYFEQCHYPLIDRPIETEDFTDFAERLGETMWTGVVHPGAHMAMDEEGLAELTAGARRLRERTDRAIIGLFGGNVFEIPQFLYRIDNHLANMAMSPDVVHRLAQELCDLHPANLEKWLGAVGPCIDVILFDDDLGGQNGPLISPAIYRELCKPYHRKLWGRAKQLCRAKVMLHSCGGIEPLLDDLIDAGLDATNPVQITCAGMEPQHLKQRFGARTCFWGGGCDTRDVLPHGTPEQVTEHVRRQVDIMRDGGGFVFQQVHNVMADVPAENVVAMFEAVNN